MNCWAEREHQLFFSKQQEINFNRKEKMLMTYYLPDDRGKHVNSEWKKTSPLTLSKIASFIRFSRILSLLKMRARITFSLFIRSFSCLLKVCREFFVNINIRVLLINEIFQIKKDTLKVFPRKKLELINFRYNAKDFVFVECKSNISMIIFRINFILPIGEIYLI